MTQLDRSVAPAIRQLEHFSILQPELHRMKNGMPLYVLSAGNEDVIRFDLLVRSGQLDQSQPLQAVFTNRMLREGTVRMTSGEIAERLDYYGAWLDLSSSVNCGFVTLYTLTKHLDRTMEIVAGLVKESVFPEEQFRIICHISKRTARYLLQSGLVPCVQSGKKTRNYTIKMKDIVRYLERREIHPEKYKLPPGSYSGTYAVKPLLPESVTTEELRKYYIESFRDIPDIVSTREAAELTGATASTVAKWIRTKKLKALSHGPAFIIPKVNLIDFMASDAYLNKRLKSQKFHENIGGFLSWKAGK